MRIFFIILFSFFFVISCSKKNRTDQTLTLPSTEENAIIVYQEALKSLKEGQYYIAMKKAPERVQLLKVVYEEEFQRAADEDEDRVPLKLQPSIQYLRVN